MQNSKLICLCVTALDYRRVENRFQTTTPLRVVVFTFSTPHKTVRELFPSYGFMTFFVICIVFIQVSPIQKKHVNNFYWDAMFEKAVHTEKGEHPDLVPYWCLTDGDEAKVKIERIVPMYPLSQDRLRYNRLIKVLSLYRLTLGQPRQEELIEIINREIAGQIDSQLFMNLSPYYK